jgi:hypothetical protein
MAPDCFGLANIGAAKSFENFGIRASLQDGLQFQWRHFSKTERRALERTPTQAITNSKQDSNRAAGSEPAKWAPRKAVCTAFWIAMTDDRGLGGTRIMRDGPRESQKGNSTPTRGRDALPPFGSHRTYVLQSGCQTETAQAALRRSLQLFHTENNWVSSTTRKHPPCFRFRNC